MRINISIEEIDNGFIVETFDHEGKASNDKKEFFEDWEDALAFIGNWYLKTLKELTKK